MSRLRGLASAAVMISTVAIVAVAGSSAFDAIGSPAYASGSCDPSGSPALVHYTVAPNEAGPGLYDISSVEISGLPSSCDGSPVILNLWGNPAGDPTLSAGADTLLSTADSSREPCSQALLTSPVVLEGGAIVLNLCSTGGPAGYATVHDLTLLSLSVNGVSVPVALGGGGSNGPRSGGSNPAPPTVLNASPFTGSQVTTKGAKGGSGLLPFTGSNIALLSFAGLVLLAIGILLFFVKRRHPITDSE